MLLMIIASLAAFAGFGAFCATTGRQMRRIWKTPPSPARIRLIRVAGWATLALALLPCIAWWGSGGGPNWTRGMGIVAWACLLPIMALALTFLFVVAVIVTPVMALGGRGNGRRQGAADGEGGDRRGHNLTHGNLLEGFI